jgi:biopolymer transport protein TolR
MRPGRLRSKMRKIREAGEAAAEEGGELNIIPYLDIVVNIIMFMLATTTFAAALGDLSVSAPSTSASASAANPDDQPKKDLNMTVSISEKGFTLICSLAKLEKNYKLDASGNITDNTGGIPTIPKINNGKDYDYDTLTKKILEIKKLPIARDETKLIINANPDIIYEAVVATMDAARGKVVLKDDPDEPNKKIEMYEGFSDVLFSAGVN